MQVAGEGKWGVKIENSYHQYASGKSAYWPEIYLFDTETPARELLRSGPPPRAVGADFRDAG